jgi:hypothetical protein
LHSTFSYGLNHQDGLAVAILGAAQAAAANTRLQTAHANLVWNPVSFVTIGIEYMWGRRTVATVALNTGAVYSNNMQAVVGKFAVAF